MRRILPPLALALIALVVLWKVTAAGGDAGAVPDARPATEARDLEVALASPRIEGPAAGTEPLASVEAARARVETPPPAATESPDPQQAALRGRFLTPDGAPAVGAAVSLHGWQSNPERVAEFGLPAEWSDPETTTDAEGRFELDFVPPGAYQFALGVHLDGFAPAGWRWSSLPPGDDRDLGTVTLEAGGSIRVSIERPDGSSAGDDWRVHGSNDGPRFGDREAARRSGEYDPRTQTWLITDLPGGAAEVAAYSEIANWIEQPGVVVRAGETVDCTLVYDGPDNASRIVVVVFTGPIHPVRPGSENVMLEGGALEERLRCEHTFGSQSHDFPDLEPGLYTVVIDDPRFERWERRGVRPGERVDAHLTGSCAIVVDVVDRETGAPVDDWSLDIRCEDVNFWPREFALVTKGGEPPADGRLGSLVPMSYTLALEAPGYPPMQLPVDDLAAGEERPVQFLLSKGGAVVGTVRSAAGDGLPGVPVELYRAEVTSPRVDWWSLWGHDHLERHRLGTTTTDDQGGFRLPTAQGGPLLLRAVGGVGLHGLVEFEHEAATESDPIEVEVPSGVHLTGRLLAPTGADFDGFVAWVGPVALMPDMDPAMLDPDIDAILVAEVDAQGRFDVGDFGVGDLDVLILNKDGGQILDRRVVPVAAAGEVMFEFDLRSRWPAVVDIEVRIGGEPAPRAQVYFESLDEQRPSSSPRVDLDGDGRDTVEIAAGRYRVVVNGRFDPFWVWRSQATFEFEPLGRSQVRIDVPAWRHTLAVVERDGGAPAVDTPLAVLRQEETGRVYRWSLTTDSEGGLDLLIPEGPLWLAKADADPVPKVGADLVGLTRVDWIASGPSPAVVEAP
ncbi:carboxypeptidase-like regulatory domain-containing protein [Engelhardtia mirabilis]|uniref:Nickel uptake substrate-specific transmembrane region n=1 Tax=Engelhardtia mirabilis TaxID=2528011 RepID=A0A518BQU7_9BACT|nr:Nickel uptake substrate-specific transmembrane region [Planctomycetes bacterium Pla133]QDV03675.1 Nickel uptake substrate-specific transmembrane region [Planctomycetes bacterium Pla86]